MEQGLWASQILPHIEAYVLPALLFPEHPRLGRAADHGSLFPNMPGPNPSDTEQFESFDDEAPRQSLEGRDTAQIPPLATSRWFARASEDIQSGRRRPSNTPVRKPAKSSVPRLVDLRILGNLALYHSRRIHAGLSYALFNRSHDLNALDDAIPAKRAPWPRGRRSSAPPGMCMPTTS